MFTDLQKPGVMLSFDTPQDFVRVHEEGTIIEQENEEAVLQKFNHERKCFDAWVLAPIPGTTTNFTRSWLVLVKVPPLNEDMEFPTTGDQFSVDMETPVKRGGNTYSLTHLLSERIANPYEDLGSTEQTFNKSVGKSAAFKVDVPRS